MTSLKEYPIESITKEHPMYHRLMQWLPEVATKLERNADRVSPKFPEINWEALAEDYNNLTTGEVLAFLVAYKTRPVHISQALIRRGLTKKEDYVFYSLPVLSVEASDLIAKAPIKEIPESEFMDYSCLSGKQYPDPNKHPTISAMDSAIPRRSNRNYTSDTLPLLKYIWQVYLVKTSPEKMKPLGKVGRPKKGSAVKK